MNLSISGIFAGLVFSSIGLFVFRRGRSESNIYLAIIGVLLFGYSYFTSSPWADWGIGLALCGGAYHYWNA